MYCFVHGYPTRNAGSWMPDTGELACGNSERARTAREEWPKLWRLMQNSKEAWRLRQAMECHVCRAERRRRCCVLQPADPADVQRFQAAPFTKVPYVHPFRHPSYHATQLRALHLAKIEDRRVLWCVAFDKPKGGSLQGSSAKMEERRERWLEYRDRATAGIPGLLPLVLDMPVRFTEAVDPKSRRMGVFKHARGVLRGWELPEAEAARVAASDAPEVVLRQQPVE